MQSKKEYNLSIIIIVILISIPFLFGLAYRYRSELRLEKRFMQMKSAVFSSDNIVAKIDLFARVNDKHLKIIFKIPCKDMKTKQDIMDNLPRIKHEMLMSMESDYNKISIEKRDFNRIKSNCLEILKKYAAVDVNKVYVDFFAHN
ncbi:MAG: hypothetical protein JXL81_02070 [Deltaproteobacteria bacterium]|nr:hypothetical protein [Deltaproteobacteria bacterium]